MESTVPSITATRLPDEFMHKNRLQEYSQRSSIELPNYKTLNEGLNHAPMFRATVFVNGVTYTSLSTCVNRKAAEQDVARMALSSIKENAKTVASALITEHIVFCKSILTEFTDKMKLQKPTYHTDQSQSSIPVFVSSCVVKGVTYTGTPARNKKEAEQLAAHAAILNILGDSDSVIVLTEIIKSKTKLYGVQSGNVRNQENIGGNFLGKEKENEGTDILSEIGPSQRIHQLEITEENNGGIFSVKEKENGSSSILLKKPVSQACSGEISNNQTAPSQPNHPLKIPKKDPYEENKDGIFLGKVTCSKKITNNSLRLFSHQFMPRSKEPSVEAFTLPITFVRAVQQQPTGVAPPPSSSKKRKRKNKKKNDNKQTPCLF